MCYLLFNFFITKVNPIIFTYYSVRLVYLLFNSILIFVLRRKRHTKQSHVIIITVEPPITDRPKSGQPR